MKDLLSATTFFNEDVVRNIVNIPSNFGVFDDLIDKAEAMHAESCIDQVKIRMNYEKKTNNFYYTTSIAFPFENDLIMASRYTDGAYPVWYGSMDVETSIHETVYHFIEMLNAIDGLAHHYHPIKSHRAIYHVFCNGILIDVHDKAKQYPKLIENDLQFCQKIGKMAYEEGLTGIISPSARLSGGVNANIFKQSALQNPRLARELTYSYYRKTVEVTEGQEILFTIPGSVTK